MMEDDGDDLDEEMNTTTMSEPNNKVKGRAKGGDEGESGEWRRP